MTASSIPLGSRRFGWSTIDIVAAVTLASAAVAEAATSSSERWTALLAAATFAATVGWCRRAPAEAVIVALISGAGLLAIGGVGLAITPLVTIVLYSTLGRATAIGGRVWIGALLLAAALPLVTASPGTPHVVDVVSVWSFFIGAPFAAGWWVGRGTVLAAELRENTDELAHRQRERTRRAASRERVRIARELHDVVAHNVSVMVVQTQAARRVALTDAAAARTALDAVSDCGRDALVDMRRMIGVLHRGDVELAPPLLAQLPALVARAEASGLRVELRVTGMARPLPPAIDLTSYRVIQEALTNVIKHAGAETVWIEVAHTPGAVELGVRDDGKAARTDEHPCGHGLVGMRERLALYGGELRAGGRVGGGFQVNARLPIDRTPRAS